MSGPRVLIVMEAQWPRALLLAALQEAGYDAVGAPTLKEALAYPAPAIGHHPLRLIILDHHVSGDDPLLSQLLQHHTQARTLFLQSALRPTAPDHEHVLRYPLSIAEILRSAEELLPLTRHTSDE
jgi:CheY-like chemotaxis protein